MMDLFTLSIIEPNLVYHMGFVFSIDSKTILEWGIQLQGWRKKEMGYSTYFNEENESFYRRIRKKKMGPNSCRNDLEDPKK